jgi:arylsulfatase A-like enzyme
MSDPRSTASPNLLLIMTDQQKATSLDLYNSTSNFIHTTGINQIADEGVLFDAACCPYPLCVPSRISALTGIYPSHSGLIYNNSHLEIKHETIFGSAKKHGCRTLLVGKDHAFTHPGIGGEQGNHPEFLDGIFDRLYLALHNGFQPPEIVRDLPHVLPWLQSNKTLHRIWGSDPAPWDAADSITARLIEVATNFLRDWNRDDRPRGMPFAMWLSIPDPHEFYQAPRDVFDSIDPASIELPPNWESDIPNRSGYIRFMHWYFNSGNPPVTEVKKLIRVYLAMCKNVDTYLARFFAFLKEIGVWNDTLVIYTSDHGDFNGEHQLIQKFNAGYDGCCRVPLVMALPSRTRAGRVCRDPVNLVDIPATVADALGWEHLPEDQGQSLAPVLFGDTWEERLFTVTESGTPGPALSTKDIANFPGHRYDIEPVGRWSYDPPHRFGGKMYAVRSRHGKLIVRQGQESEYYDLSADPWETRNVFGEAAHRDVIATHYHHLVQHLARIGPSNPDGTFARQDAWYQPGGDRTWEEVLPAEFK